MYSAHIIKIRSPRWRIRLYPRAWYSRSGSWVRAPPSAYKYSYKFVGTFSCAQIDLRKARERELATLDETSTSSGIAETLCAITIEGKNRGGRRVDTCCDHGLLSRSWKVQVWKKMDEFVFCFRSCMILLRTPRSEHGGRREGQAPGAASTAAPRYFPYPWVNFHPNYWQCRAFDASLQQWHLAQLTDALRSPPSPFFLYPAMRKWRSNFSFISARGTTNTAIAYCWWSSYVDFYPSSFWNGVNLPPICMYPAPANQPVSSHLEPVSLTMLLSSLRASLVSQQPDRLIQGSLCYTINRTSTSNHPC